MTPALRIIVFSSLACLLTPALQAQIATFNCQAPNGASLTGPAFDFLVDTSISSGINIELAEVYTDYTLLSQLLAAEKAGTAYTCTLGNGSATLSIGGAVVEDVTASAAGPGIASTNAQVYASAGFSFTSVTSGGVTFAPTPTPLSAEAKRQAFAALQAKAAANLSAKPAGRQ